MLTRKVAHYIDLVALTCVSIDVPRTSWPLPVIEEIFGMFSQRREPVNHVELLGKMSVGDVVQAMRQVQFPLTSLYFEIRSRKQRLTMVDRQRLRWAATNAGLRTLSSKCFVDRNDHTITETFEVQYGDWIENEFKRDGYESPVEKFTIREAKLAAAVQRFRSIVTVPDEVVTVTNEDSDW